MNALARRCTTLGGVALVMCLYAAAAHGESTSLATAVERLEDAVKANPESVEAQLELGMAYFTLHAYHRGVDAFSAAWELNPQRPEPLYWLGRSYEELRRYEDAEEALRACGEIVPLWGDVYAELGLVLKRVYRSEEAEEAFLSALKLADDGVQVAGLWQPTDVHGTYTLDWRSRIAAVRPAEVAYRLGEMYLDQGDTTRARGAFLRAIAYEPTYSRAHEQLGMVHGSTGDWGEAERAFGEALRLDPKLPGPHYQLAQIAARQRDRARANLHMETFHEAQADLDQLRDQLEQLYITREPATTCNNLGFAYLNQGEDNASAYWYEKAVWFDPNHVQAHNGLGYAYANLGKLDEALQEQLRAIELDADLPNAHVGLGYVWLLKAQDSRLEEDIQASADALLKALELDPELAEAAVRLGNLAEIQGRPHVAVAAYERGLQIQPDMHDVRARLARLYREQGRVEDTIAQLQLVVEGLSDAAETHYEIGQLQELQGSWDQAMASYEQARALRSDAAGPSEGLARLLVRTGGDLGRALEYARSAVDLLPGSAQCLITLARIQLLLGDPATAQTTFREALKLEPESAQALTGLKEAQESLRDQQDQ